MNLKKLNRSPWGKGRGKKRGNKPQKILTTETKPRVDGGRWGDGLDG